MQWIRSAGRLAVGLLLTSAALPAVATSAPEGPSCRADQPAAQEPTVHVLTLDDLSPERAAKIRARLARLRSGSAVVAVDPSASQPGGGLGDRLTALAREQSDAFARLQATEPELLPNGFYRLDVGRAFLTPLIAMPAPEGGLLIGHAPGTAASVQEVAP